MGMEDDGTAMTASIGQAQPSHPTQVGYLTLAQSQMILHETQVAGPSGPPLLCHVVAPFKLRIIEQKSLCFAVFGCHFPLALASSFSGPNLM